MSYTRIYDDVDMDAMRSLVHARILHPSESKLEGTALSVPITLFGEAYKNTRTVELRLSKTYLRQLVNKAAEGYDRATCETISLLYRAGLGLPKSKECHLLWDVLRSGYQPKVNGKIFSYTNMVYILKQHWKILRVENKDPNWVYFSPQNDFFRNLLQPTFSTYVNDKFVAKRKPFGVFAKYAGIDCTLVYRANSQTGEGTFWAAYAKVQDTLLNVTAQVACCPNIPKTITNSKLSSFSPFFMVNGTLTVKNRAFRKLSKYWQQPNVLGLIRASLDQDIYSLAEFAGRDLPSKHPSKSFVDRYRGKYRKATKFVDSFKGKRPNRTDSRRLEKAQHLIDTFNTHAIVVDQAKEHRQELKQYDIVDNLQFVAYDLYGYLSEDSDSSRCLRIRTPYDKVHSFIKEMGFNTAVMCKPLSRQKACVDRVTSTVLPGFIMKGLVYKLAENSDSTDLNWVKVKLGD